MLYNQLPDFHTNFMCILFSLISLGLGLTIFIRIRKKFLFFTFETNERNWTTLDYAIEVTDVSMKFNLEKKRKINSLKEYFIKLLKRDVNHDEFYALKKMYHLRLKKR
ncbi:hypothetical protein ACFTAO_42900 [Paenibacillus rhizoplanae]